MCIRDRLRGSSETLIRVELEHSVHKINGFLTHVLAEGLVFGPLDISLFNILVDRHRVRSLEWHGSDEHLKQNAPQCPDIDRIALLLSVDHFW